jgi:hypothetical protein
VGVALALIDFIQTDTSRTYNAGCSGFGDGVTTGGRRGEPGGTPGTGEVTVDPDNAAGPSTPTDAACFVWDCDAPGSGASWDSGTWTIPIDFTTGDAGTTLRAVYVCDFDGTSTYQTITSETGLSVATTAGLTTRNITQSTGWTPQSAANSRPFIVVVLRSADQHGGSSVGITMGRTINSPVDDGVTPPSGPPVGTLALMGVGI